MAQGIVTEMSPFHGHKLPRERKTQQSKRRSFTNDGCLKLIDAAKDSEDTVLFDLIMLGLYTGARIEELCQLRVEDVVYEDNCRALRITKSKTLAGTKFVPIHPSINDLVDKLVATSRDNFLIFSKSKNQYDERSTGLSRRFGRLKSSLGYGPRVGLPQPLKDSHDKIRTGRCSRRYCRRHRRTRKTDHNLWSLLWWRFDGAKDGSNHQD